MSRPRLSSAHQEAVGQRGATLIETAIVVPILLMLAIGLAEVGFLVIDHMAVANAAREGARVGAAAGPYMAGPITADTLILRSVEQALCHLENGTAVAVSIYLADPDGGFADVAKVNRYLAPVSGVLNCNAADLTSFTCAGSCSWVPPSRDNTPPDLDDIGVLVEFQHNSILGLFPFPATLDLSDRAVMRIEPDTRG